MQFIIRQWFFLILSAIVLFHQCSDREYKNIFDPDTSLDFGEWAPQNLELQQIDVDKISLNWQQREPRIEGYKIDRRQGADEWISEYTILSPETDSYIDTVSIDTLGYSYRLYSYAGDNNSLIIEDNIVPEFPAVMIHSFENTDQDELQITWSKHPFRGIENYVVWRSENTGKYEKIGETIDTTYFESSLNINSTYSYKIQVKSGNDMSELSDTRDVKYGISDYELFWQESFTGTPSLIDISFNNSYVMAADYYTESRLAVFDIKSGLSVWEQNLSGIPYAGSFNHDGSRVIISPGSDIHIYNSSDGDLLTTLSYSDDSGPVIDFDISVDDNFLIAGYNTREIVSWNLTTGDTVWSRLLKISPRKICISKSMNKVATIAGSALYIFNSIDGSEVYSNLSSTQEVYQLEISDNGEKVLTGTRNVLTVRNINDGSIIGTREIRGLNTAKFLRDSDDQITVASGKNIVILSITADDSIFIGSHQNTITDIAPSFDNKFVVTTGTDNFISVWEFAPKRLVWSDSYTDRHYPVLFSPNDDFIVGGGRDKQLRVWQEKFGWYEVNQ